MEHIEREITKEQYDEAIQYRDHSKEQRKVAENIAGMSIVCGYGLYGYSFTQRKVKGEEKYFLAMTIGSSCD